MVTGQTNILQSRLILYTFVICIIPLVLWVTDFLPLKHQRDELKEKLAGLELSLAPFAKILKDDSSLQATLQSFNERSRKLETKFPRKETQAIQALSSYAQKTNMRVVSLNIDPKAAFLNHDATEVTVDEKVCYQMPILVELVGSYKNLIRYIKTLHEDLPAMLTVEDIKIIRGNAQDQQLAITLNVNLYLLN